MAFAKMLALALVAAINLQEIYGHGRMMDPVNRSSAWRKGFPVPRNYDDTEIFCGGYGVQHDRNGGKCGECGDNWASPRPRLNENGGKYGTGVIVKRYQPNTVIDVSIELHTSHLGHFEFSLCPLKDDKELETEECFKPLPLADGSGYKFPVPQEKRTYQIKLVLPQNVTCKHCVLRWHYRAGNNWGKCPNGGEGMGCGPQETYRNCADISILPGNN